MLGINPTDIGGFLANDKIILKKSFAAATRRLFCIFMHVNICV